MRQTIGLRTTAIALLVVVSVALLIEFVSGLPAGPSVSYIANYTSPTTGATTVDNTNHTGGTINVMNLNVTQQNMHWKAYVGNVSGQLVLDDADSYSIYEWTFTTITGEVYATRSSSVTWSNVVCANSTHVSDEMTEMNHTTLYTSIDNISATFDDDANNHEFFLVGPTNISENSCNYSTQLYVNNSAQSSTEYFEEVLLYDGSANLIYVTLLQSDQWAYHQNWTFDYQMLVAEKGEPSFSGVTTYYFYAELG